MSRSSVELNANLDPDFLTVIDQLRKVFLGITKQRRGRATHTHGVTATGVARIIGPSEIPPSDFFAPGKVYPVALRHSRPSGSTDDAVQLDAGAMSLKFFPTGSTPKGPGFHDIVTNTGRALFVKNARGFLALVATPAAQRPERLIKTGILNDALLAECFRDSGSFLDYYYHSQVAYEYRSDDGSVQFLRYRIIPADRGPERGLYPRGFRPEGRTGEPRRDDDKRAADHLRQDFRARVRAGTAAYLLQVQLRSTGDSDALDPSRVWDEQTCPWLDLARIDLDRVLGDADADALDMDANRTHASIQLPLARSADDFASIGHVRAILYPEANALRHSLEAPPSDASVGAIDPANQHPLNFIARIRGCSCDEIRTNYAKLKHIVDNLNAAPLNAIGTVHFGRFMFIDPVEDKQGTYYRTLTVFTHYDGDFPHYVQDFVTHTSPLFNAILPLIEAPDQQIVPVQKNADAFQRFLVDNAANTVSKLYSAYPDLGALKIRNAATQAGAQVPAGAFEPPVQQMLNFVVPVRGSTPAEIKRSSDALLQVVSAVRPEPLNKIGTLHFGLFLLFDQTQDPTLGAYYRKLAVLTVYDGDFRRYVQGFVDEVAPFFDHVLQLVDAPAQSLVPVQKNADAFAEFLARNGKLSPARLYSNYPGITTLQIRGLGTPA